MSSTVVILVAGVNVTNSVLYSNATFESQQSATPGTFEITLKDPNRTLGPFVTGSSISLDLDGVRHFGGYVTQVSRKFALPADELPTDTRLWVLRGVDYNILFDKRVTRMTSNYKTYLPVFNGSQYDGDLIKSFCTNYLDLPAGFDSTTYVDNIARPFFLTASDATRVGSWKQQGTIWREQMELMAQWSGAVWYIDPSLRLHFHALESTYATFGFSDTPNGATTIGPRDVTASEAGGPQMTNDAMIWGGSEWTEDVVFSRSQSSSSISTHNRWQRAEHHFGEDGYKLQQGVDGRSSLIVNGSPAVIGFNPGEAFPQWTVNLTWFAHDAPAGQQIRAGQLVTTDLTTFGGALSPITLPMRSVRISFPGVDATGKGHVQLTGTMGLQLSDPFSMWGLLRGLRRPTQPVVAASTNTAASPVYGGFGQFTPVSVTSTVYKMPNDAGYVRGTTQVYKDGLLLGRDTDYTESNPAAGLITFTTAPGSAVLWVTCRTT